MKPIQPLALTRRIVYRRAYKTVELEPAPGGPFDAYDKIVSRLSYGSGPSYLSVHQDENLRNSLNEVALNAPLFALADRHIDRDLMLGALRIMTAKEGERDVAGFVRSTDAFRRPLRDVVRNYNSFISPNELDDLLGQLSDLLDSGLLNLRPDASGRTNHNRIKGFLGMLIAARWFLSVGKSSERLLVSLDSSDARRWMHLSEDPLQADLLGFIWTSEHCTISVLEVKAVQARDTEYKIKNGIVQGQAIKQMLSTKRLISQVFSSDRDKEVITTPARREILREHLYRELTKRSYSPKDRKVWTERIEKLFNCEASIEFRCHLIDVRLGVDNASLEERSVTALEDDISIPIQITQLNERQIEGLSPHIGSEGVQKKVAAPKKAVDKSKKMIKESESVEQKKDEGQSDLEVLTPDTQVLEEVNMDDISGKERPKAYLGTTTGTYGKAQQVWFDPQLPEERLPNPHILITGETGSGKTQAIKAIVKDFRKYSIPTLILDFKDDYSESQYANSENLTVYDPSFHQLPFNPLVPAIDPRTGYVNPLHHLHQLTEIIKRIYGLGDQQAYRLREAIKETYESIIVPTRPFKPDANQIYPAFETVSDYLDQDKDAKLLGRMSPIFDLGLFSSEIKEVDFSTVLNTNTVVRLAQLPGDEIKNSVAEFFLMALYNYLIRQTQSHTLSRLIVLDEAWRLIQSPFLVPLMREGRAFGLGVIIASQFPKDLPPEISGSTATKIFFSQTHVDHIREILRTVVGKTSGPEADHLSGLIRNLSPLTCVLHSKQHSPYKRVKIKPYFERNS